MRLRGKWTAIFVLTTLTACQAGGTASLETDDEIASYGFGLDIGRSLEPTLSHLDRDALLRGLDDALEGRDPAIPPEQLAEVTQRVGILIRAERTAEIQAMTESNRVEGEAYLASNAEKDGVDDYRQWAPVRNPPGGGGRWRSTYSHRSGFDSLPGDPSRRDGVRQLLFAERAGPVRRDGGYSRLQ